MNLTRTVVRVVAGAACAFLIGMPAANAQTSSDGFFGRKSEGWFWYKDPKEMKKLPPPEPEAKPEEKIEPPKPKPPERTPTFSIKWLRENLDTLRDAAIDEPTPENVRAYYYAQRVMLDKADKFAVASQHVVLTDPYLDENNNFPHASSMRLHALRLQDGAKKEGLKDLATKAGLWFFFDSKCSYCPMQLGTLKHLAQEYGFEVKAISLDGLKLPGMDMPVVQDQGQFRSLSLTMTPSLVLAVPPKTFLIVSQGVLAQTDADDRLLTIAATQNLLPEEINKRIDVFGRGVLAAEDLNNEDAKSVQNDPKQWVEYLQGKLKTKY